MTRIDRQALRERAEQAFRQATPQDRADALSDYKARARPSAGACWNCVGVGWSGKVWRSDLTRRLPTKRSIIFLQQSKSRLMCGALHTGDI